MRVTKTRGTAFIASCTLIASLTGCFRADRPYGTMLWHLRDINSEYDDFNSMAPARLSIDSGLVFSSNRLTAGGSFDIVRATVSGEGLRTTENPLLADSPLSPGCSCWAAALRATIPRCNAGR